MKPIVLYATRGGNTGKIADEIAQELSCESLKGTQTDLTSSVDLDSYDLIFVGTSIQYGNPNEDLINYLKTISLKKPKDFALFLTGVEQERPSKMSLPNSKQFWNQKGESKRGLICLSWSMELFEARTPKS